MHGLRALPSGRRAILSLAVVATLVAGCTTGAPPPRSAAGPRAVTSAELGTVLGGRASRAALGGLQGIPGAQVGVQVDAEEQDLRVRTTGTGVEVVRQGYNLDLRLPSGTAFDFNASTVRAKFRATLDALAATLVRFPATFVDITGHTDATGTDAVNQLLSEQRAAATADYLSGRGVARTRIATRGVGRAQPLASNADAAGRAANRRVEIHLSPIVEEDLRRARRG